MELNCGEFYYRFDECLRKMERKAWGNIFERIFSDEISGDKVVVVNNLLDSKNGNDSKGLRF